MGDFEKFFTYADFCCVLCNYLFIDTGSKQDEINFTSSPRREHVPRSRADYTRSYNSRCNNCCRCNNSCKYYYNNKNNNYRWIFICIHLRPPHCRLSPCGSRIDCLTTPSSYVSQNRKKSTPCKSIKQHQFIFNKDQIYHYFYVCQKKNLHNRAFIIKKK